MPPVLDGHSQRQSKKPAVIASGLLPLHVFSFFVARKWGYWYSLSDRLISKAFAMLHWMVHMRSGRNSLVRHIERHIEREVAYFHKSAHLWA